MKTIVELRQHLQDHREKKRDLPSYNELIELVDAVEKPEKLGDALEPQFSFFRED